MANYQRTNLIRLHNFEKKKSMLQRMYALHVLYFMIESISELNAI